MEMAWQAMQNSGLGGVFKHARREEGEGVDDSPAYRDMTTEMPTRRAERKYAGWREMR